MALEEHQNIYVHYAYKGVLLLSNTVLNKYRIYKGGKQHAKIVLGMKYEPFISFSKTIFRETLIFVKQTLINSRM